MDTSALTKLLIAEAETADLRSWLIAQSGQGEHAATSALGRIELMRAVARQGEPGLRERARYLLDGLGILPITDAVITLAESIGPATLRPLDAIHLASASQIRAELTSFVTCDRRLLEDFHDVGFDAQSPGTASG